MTSIYKDIATARAEVIGAARMVVEDAQRGDASFAMSVLAIKLEKLDGLREIRADYEAKLAEIEGRLADG